MEFDEVNKQNAMSIKRQTKSLKLISIISKGFLVSHHSQYKHSVSKYPN